MESSGTIKLTQHIKNKIGKFNIIYSPSRKFIWYKVPKTAGTSMFRGVILKEVNDVISYKSNPKELFSLIDKSRNLNRFFSHYANKGLVL